jgi:hypothetical protein
MLLYVGLFLLSAASLAFEINLSRIFSLAQFHHFAFMVVSLALLGYGASGTFLSLFPRLRRRLDAWLLVGLGWAFAFTAVGAYALTVHVPFDSFRIAHEWRQVGILLVHYMALAVPFFCSGTAVGFLIAARPDPVNHIYAANLVGSAAGCVLPLVAPSFVGGEGVVLLSAALSVAAALAFRHQSSIPLRSEQRVGPVAAHAFRIAHGVLVLGLVFAAFRTPSFLQVELSPYKSLSYLLQYPDAELIFQQWNGFSRVDVVRSESIRGLPGSGFRCPVQPPAQRGLTVDGDDLNTIHHVRPGFTELAYTDCLLGALPYRLRPEADTLVLEPRGGSDVVTALAQGASRVTVVEANPLIVEAVQAQGDWAGDIYDDDRVRVIVEQGRTYTRRAGEPVDVLVLSLNAPHHAVASGAYSLNEDYRYTVQAFSDYLAKLRRGGLLVVTRWLQVPPSESIRAFALAVEALERSGGHPRTDLVALRSYRQALILVRQGPFTKAELQAVRAFAEARAFDLVYLPDLRPDEVNRHNVLAAPDYYRACVDLLAAEDRAAWYDDYPFDVEPPTDDRPFFGHFFKWGQARHVLATIGHTWQPFGGAGYFVLLILLALALVAAGALVLMPIAAVKYRGGPMSATLIYFALLGVGYLCLEIPLMQRFILFLGTPAHAMTTVLFALLLFSGVGSAASRRVPLWVAIVSLPVIVGVHTMALPRLFDVALAAPLWARVIIAAAALAPLGFLMGMPLPKGIALLERRVPSLITWAWAVNGAASVVASILAALLSLSLGFYAVLALGAACYVGALLLVTSFPTLQSPVFPLR